MNDISARLTLLFISALPTEFESSIHAFSTYRRASINLYLFCIEIGLVREAVRIGIYDSSMNINGRRWSKIQGQL